jgi:hypothetical protein
MRCGAAPDPEDLELLPSGPLRTVGYTARLLSTTLPRRFLRPLPLPLALLLAACAQGGTDSTPQSDVRVTANHHMLTFRTLAGFGTFPIDPTMVFTGAGSFALADDSTFTFTLGGASTSDRYAIRNDGSMSVFFSGSGREPSVVFRGAYGLVETPPSTIFFTDRVAAGSSQSIGLYYGTRVIPGQAELAGDWHLLSMHTIFAAQLPQPAAQTAYNLGRCAQGSLTIAAGLPGETRAITGTGNESGFDSRQLSITFGGTITNLLQSGTSDGTCNLELTYNADQRVMDAFAGPDYVLAVDRDESDAEAGLAFLVQKFDAPATPADPTRVGGTFFCGGHTLFVNPGNSGADTFVGTVTLATPVGSTGAFRIDAQSHLGQQFSYTGNYTLAADGGITMTVDGTNETWFAAIDRSYSVFFFVDAIVETRSSGSPELNLGIATRVHPTTTP